MLCRTSAAAQPNSFSRPGLTPRRNNVSLGGAFKSPLPPWPPAEGRQAEQGESGNKYSRPDNGGPPRRGWGVDCTQKWKKSRRRRLRRGRSEVRLIPTLKVDRGHAAFIARALVLLFAQPGVDLWAATASRGRGIWVGVSASHALLSHDGPVVLGDLWPLPLLPSPGAVTQVSGVPTPTWGEVG